MEEGNTVVTRRDLQALRLKLLDTGTRNRLIHVNRANRRANCLNVINERADEIFNLLRVQGKRMRFKAMGKDKAIEGEDIHLAAPDADLPEDSDRFTDNFIETPLGPEALARRLLRLAGDAKTAEEEQGVNILYLAIGFLRWRETASSEIQREAPLILLPAQLVRNERTSTYDIICRDDDISTNLPLSQRLKQDFGILLPEAEEVEGWKPSDYFGLASDACSGQSGWSVDADGMQLGFFSFSKLLMHRDLEPGTWPDGAFSENPLLQGLLGDGFPGGVPLFGPEDKLDEKLDPADIIQVIDADASQTKVIEEVRYGSSLVVQGPPGTGKSQTITNIIAAAAHDGKSVLFVAEKMAALSVVHDRLVKSGLRDICLELHSRSANKKALAQELGRTLAASAQALPDAADPAQLRKMRDELNRISALLHSPIPGVADTPFQALSEIIGFIGKDAPPPGISLDGLERLDRKERISTLSAIKRYLSALEQVGNPETHPFRGTTDLDLQPTDLSRLEGELNAALEAISSLKDHVGAVVRSIQQPEPGTLAEIRSLAASLALLGEPPKGLLPFVRILFEVDDQARLAEALKAGKQWVDALRSCEHRFIPSAWDADVGAIRPAIVKGQSSWLARLFGKYRHASTELASLISDQLPKAPAERLTLLDEIATVQMLRKRFAVDEAWLQAQLGTQWRGELTPFEQILVSAKWIAELQKTGAFLCADQLAKALEALEDPPKTSTSLIAATEACIDRSQQPILRLKLTLSEVGLGPQLEDVPLSDLSDAFRRMANDLAGYGNWTDYLRTQKDVEMGGGKAIIEAISLGTLKAERAAQELSYACAEARWNAARRAEPRLNELSRLDRHELVRVFCDLEKSRIETTKSLVLARHFGRMPKGANGEMGIIRGELGRKRGHKPIRWVMKNAGTMVQRIKPVMLMSPISVAQFLPPGSVKFDLLVIDEASQVRPEDALGAIARAEQIVVVGDQKQLPPTSFFARLVDDVEDNDKDDIGGPIGAGAADMESILSLCEARGLRTRMLEWHYRSRDPSLIQVSNTEFYDDGLVLPPSPLQLDRRFGLKLTQVPGVYARSGSGLGRRGTNRIEAEAVAKAVAEHARNWPNLSLGVVAFSKTQADMVTEVLEGQRRKDPTLDRFLQEGKSEDIFVKNIENVQGDERDVILISVGYGPQEPNGRLASMSFGPINGEGGERRLNVLFSRARVRCEVFASFHPGDIDLRRVKRDGPRILKRFLEFAMTGIMETSTPTTLDADSPFEEDVASVIRSLGYLPDPQVGTAGFRIDIGVQHPDHPGQYLIAVECDGAAYHSALWARERDRLRQGVLENLGWRFYRIWSTDWFYNRKHEIEKLKNALEQARSSTSGFVNINGSNSEAATDRTYSDEIEQDETLDIDHLVLTAPAYVRADYSMDSYLQPHETPLPELADLITRIVEIEGPIHEDEIARRVTSSFGLARTGKRIVEATSRAIRSATGEGRPLKKEGAFVATELQIKNPPVRNRSGETGSLLKAEYLSPIEILGAAKQILNESGEMSPEEMTRAVANLLGFKRVGSALSEAIASTLSTCDQVGSGF